MGTTQCACDRVDQMTTCLTDVDAGAAANIPDGVDSRLTRSRTRRQTFWGAAPQPPALEFCNSPPQYTSALLCPALTTRLYTVQERPSGGGQLNGRSLERGGGGGGGGHIYIESSLLRNYYIYTCLRLIMGNVNGPAGGHAHDTLSTIVIVRYSRGAVNKPNTKFDEEHLRQFLGSLRTVSRGVRYTPMCHFYWESR